MSALRPPKLTRHTADGVKTHAVNEKRREADGTVEGRRRVYTLTYKRTAVDYSHSRPRHSLHGQHLSSQINWSVDKELKERRRLAGFDQSYGKPEKLDSDSDPESAQATEADEHEWKQVGESSFVALTLLKKNF